VGVAFPSPAPKVPFEETAEHVIGCPPPLGMHFTLQQAQGGSVFSALCHPPRANPSSLANETLSTT